jgi:hypothetical protein
MPNPLQLRRQGASGGGHWPSLRSALKGAYTFETAGNMGADASGNGAHLTLTGSVPQATGNAAPGTKASSWTDSSANHLNANYHAIPAATDFSLTYWAYVTASQVFSQFLAGYLEVGNQQYACFLDHTGSEFKFLINSTGGGGAEAGTAAQDGQGAISLNTWYFVYNYYNSNTGKVGIRRNLATAVEAATAAPFLTGTASFAVGCCSGFGGSFPLSGRIDSLNVWNRLLTEPELTGLKNGTLGLEYPF